MKTLEIIDKPLLSYLVLFRISERDGPGVGGKDDPNRIGGKPNERRDALKAALAAMSSEEKPRFFKEANHLSTSAFQVKSRLSASGLVQVLKKKINLIPYEDLLWAVEIVHPINEAHMTKEPRPDSREQAVAAVKGMLKEQKARRLGTKPE